MKRIEHIIITALSVLLAGLSITSCIYDDEVDSDLSGTISINAAVVAGTRTAPIAEKSDNTFMVLFWLDEHKENLEQPQDGMTLPPPYLAKEAPQSVSFYSNTVYDTGYPYPYPETRLLYATGYAPSSVLTAGQNYRTLTVSIPEKDKNQKLGRCDFLSCDIWSDVFKGSQSDPFAQDKNKLYFRHLAAKLVFYADRDEKSMENSQYVRNVQVTNLRMKVGNAEWSDNDCMYTPSEFIWQKLEPSDFTESYLTIIDNITKLDGNSGVSTKPKAGYKASKSEPFAGNSSYVLQRNPIDRVPIYGMVIDSCYVCNPLVDGMPQTGKIQLKMDISAEMSYDPNFPAEANGSDNGNITFTRKWNDVVLDAIYPVTIGADGKAQVTKDPLPDPVVEFKAGNEYRVYINFNRTGVDLVAKELPWNYGGIHYITITGDDKQNVEEPTK